jgi:hypothetical protein
MIIDPFIGTLDERRKALARQFLAHNGFRRVASAAFGHHVPALLRANLKPKYIFDAMSDDELVLTAHAVGCQYRQRGQLVHFEPKPDGWSPGESGEPYGFCHASDTVALAEGHTVSRAPSPWVCPVSCAPRVVPACSEVATSIVCIAPNGVMLDSG